MMRCWFHGQSDRGLERAPTRRRGTPRFRTGRVRSCARRTFALPPGPGQGRTCRVLLARRRRVACGPRADASASIEAASMTSGRRKVVVRMTSRSARLLAAVLAGKGEKVALIDDETADDVDGLGAVARNHVTI